MTTAVPWQGEGRRVKEEEEEEEGAWRGVRSGNGSMKARVTFYALSLVKRRC